MSKLSQQKGDSSPISNVWPCEQTTNGDLKGDFTNPEVLGLEQSSRATCCRPIVEATCEFGIAHYHSNLRLRWISCANCKCERIQTDHSIHNLAVKQAIRQASKFGIFRRHLFMEHSQNKKVPGSDSGCSTTTDPAPVALPIRVLFVPEVPTAAPPAPWNASLSQSLLDVARLANASGQVGCWCAPRCCLQ